ncbi:MAG: hypothetical protein AB7P03_06930 [Kofleriaceae bacterium]
MKSAWVVVTTAASVVACYSPAPQQGLPCGPGGACPTGQRCEADSRCYADPFVTIDADPIEPDGPTLLPSVTHVDPADVGMLAGAGDWAITEPTTIDTTTMTASPPCPMGVRFALASQPAIGELAILDVRDLSVEAELRVIGTRGLVIAAAGTVTISDAIDAGALGTTPGAGGFDPGAGDGAGSNGVQVGNDDSGAGGAGFATAGGDGGDGGETGAVGGAAGGLAIGDPQISTLVGGSGGGAGLAGGALPCALGGAGGGAIQITARTIVLDGVISAGGGGGRGGRACSGAAGSGGGGGAGGAIYLEAGAVLGAGAISANGGGGGEGSDNILPANGDHGDDGPRIGGPAAGGSASSYGGNGGAGGSIDGPTKGGRPQSGTAAVNAGGGGGAAGRIYVSMPATEPLSVTCHPACVRSP